MTWPMISLATGSVLAAVIIGAVVTWRIERFLWPVRRYEREALRTRG